jgi:hypothetical protein
MDLSNTYLDPRGLYMCFDETQALSCITLPASVIAIATLKLCSSCPTKQPVIGPSEIHNLLNLVKFISHFIVISVNRYINSQDMKIMYLVSSYRSNREYLTIF